MKTVLSIDIRAIWKEKFLCVSVCVCVCDQSVIDQSDGVLAKYT